MRLSDALSKPVNGQYFQVENFAGGRKLPVGKQKKLSVGKVALNFYCKNCGDMRTFCSEGKLYAIPIDVDTISIDCRMSYATCNAIWFVLEVGADLYSASPRIRVQRRNIQFSTEVSLAPDTYGECSKLLEKSAQAFSDGLGAGSIVYLRKAFEEITVQTAKSINLEYQKREDGNPGNFSKLLKRVDERCAIIPKEFSNDRYKLFSELSGIVHGDYNEKIALQKYDALYRLILGVLENIQNSKELTAAIQSLGWSNEEENGK